MKRITINILLILSSIISFSQDWQYHIGNNAFDGEYKSASTIGVSDNYPYVTPILNINVFNERTLNFYIKNSGFTQEGILQSIMFLPDAEPKVIYYANKIDISKDGKTVFINSFKNDYFKNISILNFLEILKKSSKIDVRIKTEFGNYDMVFKMAEYRETLTKILTKEFLSNSNLTLEDIKQSSNLILKTINDNLSKESEEIKKIEELLLNIGVEKKELNEGAKKLITKLNDYNIEVDKLSRIDAKIGYYKKNVSIILYDIKGVKITSVLLDLPNFLEKLKRENN